MTRSLERAVHFVGTYPISVGGDRAAMEEMLAIAGPYLRSLPSGETERLDWITDEDLESLQHHPDVRVLDPSEDPDPNDYLENKWKMDIKKGHTLRSKYIDLRYHAQTQANWPAFSELRTVYKLSDLAYQVNVPGTLQTPMFAFRRKSTVKSLVNGLRYRKPMEEALQREIDAINSDPQIGTPGVDKNHELVYQIEIPAEAGGMNKMPAGIQVVTNPVLGAILTRGITRQVQGLPEGARAIIHGCNGDWKHRAYSESSTELLVALNTAIINQWPDGRELAGIHFPFAAGEKPPSLETSHYAPLGKLAARLPRATRFIAGIIHEGLEKPQDQLDTLKRIEDIMQRPVDVAATCGFGRVPLRTARMLTRQAVELVENAR